MGHLVLAMTAMRHLKLDELRWVPAGAPWQKDRTLVSGAHRAGMIKAAITGHRGFKLDRREIERPGPSYTIDTVRESQLAEPNAKWFLVIGQDQYERLTTWQEWRELITRVTLAVAGRDGRSPTLPSELLAVWHRIEPLPMPPMNVSSTAIRAHLAAGGAAQALVPDMVPTVVARYIDRYRLYAPPRGGAPAA
ncbi:nicotinate (nicotinamide) nucleotide adenylyltransferase [Methylibium sp.]|uniref:nicotinate (nicotinamide) nucleotide adenylyltransferase n=1 Tax=Methylibium sp. TaxID=2067992 RepID=UPI003D0BB43B